MSDMSPSTEAQDDLPTQMNETRTRTTLPGALDSSPDKEQQAEDKYFRPTVIALVAIIAISLLLALFFLITG